LFSRITPLNGGTASKLEYICRPDAGGALPAPVFNPLVVWYLCGVTRTQQLFQERRGLGEWDAEDGAAIGESMLARNTTGGNESPLATLFERNKGLREASALCPGFQTMMARVAANKLRPPGGVSAKLQGLTDAQAETIGAGLASCLLTAPSADSAVAEWISKYPALRELDEFVWFRPMMDAMATRLLATATFGAKLRMYSGASIGIIDTVRPPAGYLLTVPPLPLTPSLLSRRSRTSTRPCCI
jgi:hypothetical protein